MKALPSRPSHRRGPRLRPLAVASLHGLYLLALPAMAAADSQPEPIQSRQPDQTALHDAHQGHLLKAVQVTAGRGSEGYAMVPETRVELPGNGPLGKQSWQRTPYMVSQLSADVMVNQLATDPTDLLGYLPSTQLGQRPQTRGMVGEVVSNSRLDGLNVIDTTAYPIEALENVTVLNGLAGSLYGPTSPSGVFDYTLKRPTDERSNRIVAREDGRGQWTGQLDLGGRLGRGGWLGYRINALHGEGSGVFRNSSQRRDLLSAGFDIHLDDKTLIQLDGNDYDFHQRGFPGNFTYGSQGNTRLPGAPDPHLTGLAEPYAGLDEHTRTYLGKVKHQFNDHWRLTAGVLKQIADRYLGGVGTTLIGNQGQYRSSYGQGAASRFTVVSNSIYLNGEVDTGSIHHELSFGTNGFSEHQYYGHNPGSTTLGNGNLDTPILFPQLAWGQDFGHGHGPLQARNAEQSLIAGDTVHFNEQWALLGVISSSWLRTSNYTRSGALSNTYQVHHAISPTLTAIYTPDELDTLYFSWARSIQPGDVAPASAVNANEVMAPYRSRQYELGYKRSLGHTQLGMALFHIERAYSFAGDDDIYRTQGTQRNNGIELSANGQITSRLSVLGGASWIDARLQGTSTALTDNRRVVGVPQAQAGVLLDYLLPIPTEDLWAISLGGQYRSRVAATTSNSSYAAAYVSMNLGARWQTRAKGHPLIVRLQLENLTDRHYWASLFPGSSNGTAASYTAVMGTPRTFSASVELDL